MFRQSPTRADEHAARRGRQARWARARSTSGLRSTPEPRKARPKLPPVELGPIIKSKIQPPALRPSTLSRQRLIDQLIEATTHRLTLLVAEAGYGKTTLLADFAGSLGSRPCGTASTRQMARWSIG